MCHGAAGRDAERLFQCKSSVFLIDTNVVSELSKARPHGAMAAWPRRGIADAELYLFHLYDVVLVCVCKRGQR